MQVLKKRSKPSRPITVGLRSPARRKSAPKPTSIPEILIHTYLTGRGLEIHALHHHVAAPPKVLIQHVTQWPAYESPWGDEAEMAGGLAEATILDDDETLSNVTAGAQDFVMVNYFLEHCEDPIGFLKKLHRVLRPAGVLWLTVGDARQTVDRDRPLTPIGHLYADHWHGPACSRRQHLEEWVWLVCKAANSSEAEHQIAYLDTLRYSIHFHVWSPANWLEFMQALRLDLGFDLIAFLQHGPDMISVLRKHDGQREPA